MQSKNLGPFTGRQLTTIIVAFIAALMIPTGAYAVVRITHTVIQDSVTKTAAGVTPTGNLKVAVAAPEDFFYVDTAPGAGFDTAVVSPPAGSDLVMTTIHVNVFANPSPGSASSVDLFVAPNAACNTGAGPYFEALNPGELGEQDISLGPGVNVPSGDFLCAGDFGNVQSRVAVSGYTVPAGTVAAAPVHPRPADPAGR
jgi:hypothetical protein